eukprot:6177584-Karenia_brevis.AAC.1
MATQKCPVADDAGAPVLKRRMTEKTADADYRQVKKRPAAGQEPPAITSTIVWQALEGCFHMPAEVINALFMELA